MVKLWSSQVVVDLVTPTRLLLLSVNVNDGFQVVRALVS